MSVDNLTMLHTAALNSEYKPKLMLPNPSRYSSQGGSPLTGSPVSTPSFEHRPPMQHSQSFSLPPIRELLRDASTPAPSPQLQPSPAAMPTPMPIPVYHHPQPQAQAFMSVSPPPPQQLGRSSSLPNYLSQQGRVPSPMMYQAYAPAVTMMPTPESRSRSSSPVSDSTSTPSSSSALPVISMYEPSKEAKLTSRKKRQNLPRQTTLILLGWLSEHLDRPYPNSREKYELLMKTRLTIQQLDNWFINARRRKIHELRKLKENDQSIALMF